MSDFKTIDDKESVASESAYQNNSFLQDEAPNITGTEHAENIVENSLDDVQNNEADAYELQESDIAPQSTDNSEEVQAMSLAPEKEEQEEREEAENKQKKKIKKKRGFWGRLFLFFSWLFVVGSVIGVIAIYAILQWAAKDLPSITKVADFRPPLTTTVLARDGSLIDEIYFEKRYLVNISDLPKHVPMAFVSAEDNIFYTHIGISPKAILRAAYTNFISGATGQGGSTITQQVVKRLLLTPERTYTRKIKEMLLAFQLERQLSKDDILNIYLNQIHMGGRSYGVEAGARYYFSKSAKDLTIAEAALLAGILPATTKYNPYRNPEAARTRQVYVLGRMREDGVITDAQYEEAYYTQLEFSSSPEGLEGDLGAWYIAEVRRELVELFSQENSIKYGFDYGIYGEQAIEELGLTVYTSMEPVIQGHAEAAMKKGLENSSKRRGWSGPIDTVESTAFGSYLAENPFKIEELENDAWVQVLVTEVTKKGAKVRLGTDYHGFIDVSTMGWARKPNKTASGDENSKNIKDATKVLNAGDVVYARFMPDSKAKKEAEKLVAEAQKAEATPETEASTENQENTEVQEVVDSEKEVQKLLLGNLTTESSIPLALEQLPEVQGAFIALEPKTSDVVALVGGYKFGLNGNHFNRATLAYRQTGSAFKPIVYSTALDYGFTVASEILDAPIVLIDPWTKEVWRPSNFDRTFDGRMSLSTALARSRNLATVRIAQQVGMPAIVERAKVLGLEGRVTEDLAASLGAVEVTPISIAKAYSAFANNGINSEPRLIQSIQGPWGNTIYENIPEQTQVISQENAYLMATLLRKVVTNGSAARANALGVPLGGKTGTTNNEVDAWFIGVTPNLITTTYVGFDLPQAMGRGETGSRAALPIFIDFADDVLPLYPEEDFVAPSTIKFYNGLPFAPGTSPSTSVNVVDSASSSKSDVSEDLLKQLF